MSDEFYPARSDEFYPNRRAPSPDPRPAAQPGVVKALERARLTMERYRRAGLGDDVFHADLCESIAAADVAIAAPVSQEPVAWRWPHPLWPKSAYEFQIGSGDPGDIPGKEPLYLTPLTEGEPREAEVERVAARLWKAEAEDAGAPASVAQGRTRAAFDEQSDGTKDRWRKFARAALLAVKSKGGQADG